MGVRLDDDDWVVTFRVAFHPFALPLLDCRE